MEKTSGRKKKSRLKRAKELKKGGINNPGNLRNYEGVTYQGELPEVTTFINFDHIDNGIRAIFVLLRHYIKKHGLINVGQIISVYAPALENNIPQYLSTIATMAGLTPSTIITEGNIDKLVKGILIAESSYRTSDETLNRIKKMA